MNEISLIIPCYNEQESLKPLYQELLKTVRQISDAAFEFIFVDDGSEDASLEIIKNLSERDTRVKYISFSRNFGKEAALYAGLESAGGAYIAVMDADMQDPPSYILDMYSILKTGDYDCVAARRITRTGEPVIRSIFAQGFYYLINKISLDHLEITRGARDFRMMTRKMCNAILDLKEYNRFSKGIFSWVGFKTKWLSYENIERSAGNSKWSFFSLFLYALQGIIAFSTIPLSIASIAGFLFCVIAFLLTFVIVVKTVVWGDSTMGWPSMACFILFMSGIQLLCMGILGEYVSRLYLESKKRPIYIARESNIHMSNQSGKHEYKKCI